jgi:type I restriction enzyme R subunit
VLLLHNSAIKLFDPDYDLISLLRNMEGKNTEDQDKARKNIMSILDTETHLRSKKELIEKFISKNFADMPASANVGDEFVAYWTEEKHKIRLLWP